MSLLKKLMKFVKKMLWCPRAVNAGFVIVCFASAMGWCSNPVAMAISAVLYLLLVWLG